MLWELVHLFKWPTSYPLDLSFCPMAVFCSYRCSCRGLPLYFHSYLASISNPLCQILQLPGQLVFLSFLVMGSKPPSRASSLDHLAPHLNSQHCWASLHAPHLNYLPHLPLWTLVFSFFFFLLCSFRLCFQLVLFGPFSRGTLGVVVLCVMLRFMLSFVSFIFTLG